MCCRIQKFSVVVLYFYFFIPPPTPSGGSKLCHLKVMHILNLFDQNSEFLVRYGIESWQINFNVYS